MLMRDYATSYEAAAENVALFRRALSACKVQPGESVLIFTDALFNPSYAAGFLAAASDLGAYATEMCVPSTTPGLDSKVVRQAWLAADMVVGMTRVPWLYSSVHDQARQGGTRTLMVGEPIDVLRRLSPDPSVHARGVAGVPVLSGGRSVHVTSAAGTDLRVPKAGRQAYTLCGHADEPGKWDHWPQGLVCFFAERGAGEGTVVVDVGDVLLPLRKHATQQIRLQIRDGKITTIEGGSEAAQVRAWFEQFNDARSFELAHVGWGTEHRAIWSTIGMDSESYYGNFMVAFGRNVFWPVGGENDVASHWDTCLLNHTFEVDDQVIVDRGRILPEALK
jgi:2,5-dihydroxypyridine 5,6-dioxygenase